MGQHRILFWRQDRTELLFAGRGEHRPIARCFGHVFFMDVYSEDARIGVGLRLFFSFFARRYIRSDIHSGCPVRAKNSVTIGIVLKT